MDSIVFFDGECDLCNGAVRFLRRRDGAGRFRFVPLGSEAARRMLGDELGVNRDTFVLSEGGRMYDRSTAALRALRRLGGLWPLLYPLVVIPRPWRDSVYTFVARRRSRWSGGSRCRL